MIIVQDSREQKPYWRNKKNEVETKTLQTGDYTMRGYEHRVSIERKSMADLFGTVGKGHRRFKNELERGMAMDYFGIYVEGTRERIKNKDFPGSYHSKMRGYVVLKILDTIKEKYDIDVVYCESRVKCKRAIKKKFSLLESNYKSLNTNKTEEI